MHSKAFQVFTAELGEAAGPEEQFAFTLIRVSISSQEANRFKGLDLIECLKNYGQRFMTFYRRQRSRPSPRKRNAKEQNGCLRGLYK